jgi:hypothetical protein
MDDVGGDAGYDAYSCCGPVGDTTTVEYHGTTDADGSHYLQLDFEDADGALPDLPVVVTAEATVTDVNRQAWADRTNLLVHAADEQLVHLYDVTSWTGDELDLDRSLETLEVLRAAATAGMRNLRLAARRADGSVAGFAAEFREDLDPGALEGTVRVAQGGFYVGRRGDLLQITRVAGTHDYAGLARQLATRQAPYVVAPASNTSWTVVLETVAVAGEVAAAGGTTPILAPPPG